MFASCVSESGFVRAVLFLWNWLCGICRGSVLARLTEGWKRWWHGSALVRFWIEKEGELPRAWPQSVSCRLLSWVINLPASALHWIYRHGRALFDGSFFAQLAFGMGEQVPIAAGWLMLLLMNIPYDNWNNAYSLAGYFLLLLLTVAAGMRRRSLRLDAAAVGPYLVCFLFAVCLAWPMSCVPSESFRFLYYHGACALCVLVIVSTVERAEQLERLAGFGCLGMLGASLYALYQRVQGVEVSSSTVDLSVNANMPGRVFSFYDNSNAFASVLVLLVPVGVGLLFGAKRTRYRVIGLISALFGTLALLMTYSRACWLGLIAAAAVFVFLWKRKLMPLFILAGIALIPFLPSSILNRFLTIFNTSDSSISSRGPIYRAALRLVSLRPVSGAGLGTSAVQAAIDAYNVYDGKFDFVHSHNTFLQVWAETGLLGLVSFVAAMYNAVKSGAKAVLCPGAPQSVRMVLLGAVSGLAGSMVCGLADYLWSYPRVMLIFWFTAALLLAGVRLVKRETEVSR